MEGAHHRYRLHVSLLQYRCDVRVLLHVHTDGILHRRRKVSYEDQCYFDADVHDNNDVVALAGYQVGNDSCCNGRIDL